jgi:hypothetical protein
MKTRTLLLVLPFSLVPLLFVFEGFPLGAMVVTFFYFWLGYYFGYEVRSNEVVIESKPRETLKLPFSHE